MHFSYGSSGRRVRSLKGTVCSIQWPLVVRLQTADRPRAAAPGGQSEYYSTQQTGRYSSL